MSKQIIMKHTKLILALAVAGFLITEVKAGNPDRVGQAGATELLVNPWARSSGWGGANSGSVRGVEALFLNVAGTAGVKKTEAAFSHTQYLRGSDISINTLGLAQRLGETGALSFAISSFDFGDIVKTTEDQPEGGLGTFSPQYLNLTLAYSKKFSNSIYGGMAIKAIDERIDNVGARGVALDAGIQYVTGHNADRDNIKFGIVLKNVGSQMKYEGDGLATRVIVSPSNSQPYEMTIEQRTNSFEMPSLVNIGVTYDISLAKDHRLTVAANFTSNSFSNDQYSGGLEYSFMNIFMLRGGYTFEKDWNNEIFTTTVLTGPSAGLSFDIPLGKTGKSFSIDYSYRATRHFDGTHSFGGRFTL